MAATISYSYGSTYDAGASQSYDISNIYDGPDSRYDTSYTVDYSSGFGRFSFIEISNEDSLNGQSALVGANTTVSVFEDFSDNVGAVSLQAGDGGSILLGGAGDDTFILVRGPTS